MTAGWELRNNNLRPILASKSVLFLVTEWNIIFVAGSMLRIHFSGKILLQQLQKYMRALYLRGSE